MAARYSRAFMPLSKVKEKEFLSRPMGCKGIGFSFVRCKPGEGATKMPEGTIVRVGPTVWRALGNDSKSDVVFMVLGAVPPKNFPLGGRTLLGDGIPNRRKVPRWKKA